MNAKKKEPSLRDSMFGKNIVKNLPEGFFERLLECEVKLKKGFNMNLLQELITYYTAAVEYYESIDDPKYKHYSNSLNLLFTQPEIAKYMNGSKKVPQQNHKLEVKKKMEKKNKQDNVIKVQSLLKQVTSTEAKTTTQNMKGMIDQDMDSQMSTFQKRKEEKKKKILLSTSDITDAVETMRNKRPIQNRNVNKSFDMIDKDQIEHNETPGNTDNILSEINKQLPISSFNGRYVIGNQNKTTELIQDNMSKYINNLGLYINDKIMPSAYSDIEKLLKEKENKILENTRKYVSQINDSNMLLTADGDLTYKDELGKIIYELEKEEKTEEEKIDKRFKETINLFNESFNERELTSNVGLKSIQEIFKLSITNNLTSLIN